MDAAEVRLPDIGDARGIRDQLDEWLRAVLVLVEAPELLGVERTGELDVTACEQPLVEGQEVRDEGQRARSRPWR